MIRNVDSTLSAVNFFILLTNPWGDIMAVKHTPTSEVHRGTKGGKTGCGFDTKEHPNHWVASSQKITCKKNGCKN